MVFVELLALYPLLTLAVHPDLKILEVPCYLTVELGYGFDVGVVAREVHVLVQL